MSRSILVAAVWLLGATAVAQDPVELTSRIDAVTVYPSSARVRRITAPVPGSGRFALRGLPASLEPASVRVRCRGGFVIGVEVRERIEDRTPEVRVQELRDRIVLTQRRIETQRDDLAVSERMRGHLKTLLERAGSAELEELEGGAADTDEWARRHELIASSLRENLEARRELRWKIEEEEAQLRALEEELGRVRHGTSVSLRDLLLKVVTPKSGVKLEVEYLVAGASWRPRYDLRAASDGRGVKLVYRGEVQQSSGEDWKDVQLLLSSAEPKRSARGPELDGRWVRLYDPKEDVTASTRAPRTAADLRDEETLKQLEQLGYTGSEEADEPPFAAVQDEGLSVRFAVRGRDSVETAGGRTTVLIGEADFTVDPEYYCVPALDTTVWLRGHTENDSEWPILAGEASVFFGEDFLGRARLEMVERGQEFIVPLGAADAITCERVLTTDRSQGPSVFGSTQREVEGWKLTFANGGGAISSPDGSVAIVVREAIPKPTDKSIEVELTGLSHPLARADKWREDAEELGIETWILRVPRRGEVDLRYQVVVSHPKKHGVVYR